MKKIVFVVAAVAILAALLLATGVSMYNSIVRKDIAVNEKWSQVQNVLQRRADLIPNLVQTVKGYAAHEKEIFEYVAAARARLARGEDPAGAEGGRQEGAPPPSS